MAQDGSSAPRRALGPPPDLPEGNRSGDRFAADDIAPASTSPGRLRRLALSPDSPVSPVDPLDIPSRTPVPPPAPVMPDPESALPPASGRRFSASAEPSEFASAAPRRSAVSAASPSSAIEPVLPPVVRPTVPPGRSHPFTPSPSNRSTPAATPPAFTPGPVSQLAPAAPGVPSTSAALTTPVVTTPGAEPGPWEPDPVAPGSAAPEPRTPGSATPEPAEPAPKRRRFGRKPRPGPTPAESSRSDAGSTAAPVPTLDAPGTGPDHDGSAISPPQPEPTAHPAGPRRSARPAVVVIAAVLTVAVLIAAAVWLLTLRSGPPGGGATNSPAATALDPLLTAAELGTLGGVAWSVESTSPTESRPLCLPATGSALPEAARSTSRRTDSSTGSADALVQVADTYADEAEAVQAFDARVAQAGMCEDAQAWLTGANTVAGLADGALALRYVVQDEADLFHTVLVSRTGTTVNLSDLTTTGAAVPALDLANVTGRALSRQCGTDLGTCPSSISVETALPPAGAPAGWLVAADLPRVTPGAGRWGAIEPEATVSIPGSQCEAMNLGTVSGTQATGQRTLLLADDPDAPRGFGVDMVTYSFADEADAAALAKKLTRNIAGCPDRAPTATIEDGPAVKGSGEGDVTISGSTFLITQKTETTTVLYRVAVLSVGNEVVYLLGTPTKTFDFTDVQWKAIAVRAGLRATQA